MSNIRVKDLPEKIDNLSDDDLVMIEDNEDTKKITLLKLRSAFSMDGILISMKEMLLTKFNTFMETHNKRYAELVERNTQLEARCHNLENDHIHDANRIFELENKLVKQTEFVKTLIEEKNTLNQKVIELQGESDILTNQIVDLNEILRVRETDIKSLDSRYTNLQNNYNTLKTENENLKTTISDLEIVTNTNIDNFVEEKNKEITNKFNDIMDYIRYYHPDVDDLEV